MATVYIDEIIRTAVTPTVSTCLPYVMDDGDSHSTEYCTFNYAEYPDLFAESKANAIYYIVQIHYFCPRKTNPNEKKRQLRNALINAGFTTPSIINASDKDGQHFVFECEYSDDGGLS